MSKFYFSLEHVGIATNNFAELQAIRNALAFALELKPAPTLIQFFSDNMYALKTITGEWSTQSNVDLVKEAQACLAELSKHATVHLMWVPGHADVYGNEVADRLAKRGAKGSTSTSPLSAEIFSELEKLPAPCPPAGIRSMHELADDIEVSDDEIILDSFINEQFPCEANALHSSSACPSVSVRRSSRTRKPVGSVLSPGIIYP